MNTAAAAIELAPAGVLRAAAWPLESLDHFGDGELAVLARAGSGGPDRLERAYAAAIDAERDLLWRRCMDDNRFRCALALASPSALRRCLDAASRRDGPRNRALRLAEYTLYRYLARAAGRATPQGLWAGVGALQAGPETRFEPVAPAAVFSPDLKPFQALLRSLAPRDDYLLRAPWVLNPSLRKAQGWFEFLHRRPGGGVERRRIEVSAALSESLKVLRLQPPSTLPALAAAIAGAGTWPVGARRELLRLLRSLAEGGVLVGGLDLPTCFETPWQALAQAGAALRPEHSRHWLEALDRLQGLCAGLGPSALAADAARLGAGLEEAGRCLRVLATALDLPSPPVGVPLRCDLRLPWRLRLGPDLQWRLALALAAYDRNWQAGASPAAAHRREQRRALAQAIGTEGQSLADAVDTLLRCCRPPPEVWPQAEGSTPELAVWAAALSAPQPEVVLEAGTDSRPAAPLGCLFAALDADSSLELRSVADVPALAGARFAGVIDLASLTAWLEQRLDGAARQQGRRWLEWLAPFEGNPNALASPSYRLEPVAPWSAAPGAISLAQTRVFAPGPDGELALDLGDGGAPAAVCTTRVADLAAGDPLAQLLLWTSGHESPGRRQRAVDVPIGQELDQPRFAPRIRLPGGALLRERRTLLREALPRLLRLRGAGRFQAWQTLARDLDWPQQLQLAVGQDEPLRVHRDSPLALEAVFKGLRPDAPWLSVAAATPRVGPTLPDGHSHVVELALPFARRI